MRTSVLIPTHGRPEKLARCLRALSTQNWLPGDEVVVGFDGPDPRAEAIARGAFDAERLSRTGVTLRLEALPRMGYIAVRHRLLPTLAGDVLISLNDDVRPAPGFVDAHRRAIERSGTEAAFVGFSPFARVDRPTAIDRLVMQSSWVFFYDRMIASGEPAHDWGFRHLFGLNFSARLDTVRSVGGFTEMPAVYGYDDIELGHRLAQAGLGVRFLSGAVALHDHRMSAEALLRREHALGVAAAHYARAKPAFAAEVFGRDILGSDAVAACRERRIDPDQRSAFLALDHEPGGSDSSLPAKLLERFRPLKRAAWAAGCLEAIGSFGAHPSAA